MENIGKTKGFDAIADILVISTITGGIFWINWPGIARSLAYHWTSFKVQEEQKQNER